jgi:hypothetical protein
MSNLKPFVLQTIHSAWLKIFFLLMALLLLALAAGAPVCIGCLN